MSLQLRLDERTKAMVQYGAELFIGYLLELIALIVIAALFGMLKYSIPIFIAVNIFTFLLDSRHFSTYAKCFLMTVIIYTFLPWMAMMFIPNISFWLLRIFTILIALYSVYVILNFALMPGHNKRIKNEAQRVRLKTIAVTYIVIWNCIVLLISFLSDKDIILPAFASAWGLLLQSFILTPAGGRLFVKIDKLLG